MATTFAIGTGSGGVGTARVGIDLQLTLVDDPGAAVAAILSNANSPCYPQSSNLSSGVNTITVPTKAGGVVIMPPSTNTQTITLKGASGDTGVALSKTAPTVLTFDTTPPGTIVLTTGGVINDTRFYWF